MQHNKHFLVLFLLVFSAEISFWNIPLLWPLWYCGLLVLKLSENLSSACFTSCFFFLLLPHNEDILFSTGNSSSSHCALHTESLQSLSPSSQNLSWWFQSQQFQLLLGFLITDNQLGFNPAYLKRKVIYLYSLNSKLRLSLFCFY